VRPVPFKGAVLHPIARPRGACLSHRRRTSSSRWVDPSGQRLHPRVGERRTLDRAGRRRPVWPWDRSNSRQRSRSVPTSRLATGPLDPRHPLGGHGILSSPRGMEGDRAPRNHIDRTKGARYAPAVLVAAPFGDGLEREPGESPGLPRSGERERTPSRSTGAFSEGPWEATGNRPPVSCRRKARESEDLPAPAPGDIRIGLDLDASWEGGKVLWRRDAWRFCARRRPRDPSLHPARHAKVARGGEGRSRVFELSSRARGAAWSPRALDLLLRGVVPRAPFRSGRNR